MTRLIVVSLSALILTLPAAAQERTRPPTRGSTPSPLPAEQPLIQVAILLDTSGSMTGLIEQAKTQLWKIVNEIATSRQNGRAPRLEVSLYQYGTPSLGADNGFIRQLTPLTTDLDSVSEKLFALRTDGGDEYCGWVIQTAVRDLKWSNSSDVYRAIFIAGNEPFTQGGVDYRESCKAAITKGIIVNTIHCGDEKTGINTNWKDGAMLADGRFMIIDQNRATVHFDAPQDEEIARLGQALNSTYVAYGDRAQWGVSNQTRQDSNALGVAGSAAAERAVTKAGKAYDNAYWDLVDASNNASFDLEEVDVELLPEAMRDMTHEQRVAYVEEHAAKRAELQQQINDLNTVRMAHIAELQRKHAEETGVKTLDAALIEAVREQLVEKNFDLKSTATNP